jgi:hypothetical protein
MARIKFEKRTIYLGTFNCLIKAAKTYDEAALKYHGEFSKTNNI